MPTFSGNAYNILSQVRYGINEYSSGLANGTDTTGSFKNAELMQQINMAQGYLWGVLKDAFPDLFLTSASLAFTASVATLPSDCWKIRDIVNSDGFPIRPISVRDRHISSGAGSTCLYYRYGNTLRIDADGVTDTGTIWYYSRCRDLDTGAASATNTLALTAKAIADYYNGMVFENITDSTVDTITDYTAARIITSTGGITNGDYYGIVTELPEVFQPLIADYTVLQMKKNPKVPLQVTQPDITLFGEMLAQTLRTFAGTQNGDTTVDDVFNDFAPML